MNEQTKNMAMTTGSSLATKLANATDLPDLLQNIEASDISGIIESITYNLQSRTIIIQIKNLLSKESRRIESLHPRPLKAIDDLTRLSNSYREKYPELLKCYKNWKPFRENLIKTSSTCANRIGWNTAIVSAFRIVTSTADLIGTVMRYQQSKSYWAHFAAENASYCGLFSLLLEMMLSKRLFNKVKKTAKKDQEMFTPMKDWFQQYEELGQAVKNIFPYGIDEDLVRKIDKSCSDSDDTVKIFMSVIASNVKNDLNLFKNINFLEMVEAFSSSEFGVKWFNKIILEQDPVWSECMKCSAEENIRSIMPVSTEGNPDLIMNGSLVLTRGIKFKILLDMITIYSAVTHLWDDDKCEESDMLKELSRKTSNELEGMKHVVRLLKPSGIDIDEELI